MISGTKGKIELKISGLVSKMIKTIQIKRQNKTLEVIVFEKVSFEVIRRPGGKIGKKFQAQNEEGKSSIKMPVLPQYIRSVPKKVTKLGGT